MSWDNQTPPRPVVAVAGATGAVGREMLLVLEQRGFPAERVIALASHRSAGRKLPFAGGELEVQEMVPDSFEGVDLALFSAGASVSRELAPEAVARGCVVVDNSSAFRMDEGVPLVVPEVNTGDLAGHAGIIANPNCSTIQMVVALQPLAELAPVERIVVSTYQSASGAGQAAMDELVEHTRETLVGASPEPEAFRHQIAFNCIPHIDVFVDEGATKEEWKMVVETRKIMHLPDVPIGVTCVRVPVLRCHSEAIHISFAAPVDPADARDALAAAPGVVVLDDPEHAEYPMPADLAGSDGVYVGRIRRDPSVEHGLALWVVADQLRKGAALNAVQIAEALLP